MKRPLVDCVHEYQRHDMDEGAQLQMNNRCSISNECEMEMSVGAVYEGVGENEVRLSVFVYTATSPVMSPMAAQERVQ